MPEVVKAEALATRNVDDLQGALDSRSIRPIFSFTVPTTIATSSKQRVERIKMSPQKREPQ